MRRVVPHLPHAQEKTKKNKRNWRESREAAAERGEAGEVAPPPIPAEAHPRRGSPRRIFPRHVDCHVDDRRRTFSRAFAFWSVPRLARRAPGSQLFLTASRPRVKRQL